MSVEIRRYCDGDAAAVWRLHSAGLDQRGANLGNGQWDDNVRAVAQTYLDGGEFLVGHDEKELR